MADEILVLENVVITLGKTRVLDGFNLTLKDGERVSLLGESTAGKSTVLKIIVGLLLPDSGNVYLFGHDLKRLSENERLKIRKDLAMQFQYGALFDSMTVSDNIRFVLDEVKGLSKKAKEERIEDLLRQVKLWSSRDKYPHELSGGMQKRVAVARAISSEPRLALFDEPAAGLDPVTSVHIVEAINKLAHARNMAMVVATTSVHLARQFSETFVIMRDGRIHDLGPWYELFEKGDDYTKKFLSRDLIPQKPGKKPQEMGQDEPAVLKT
jgi:phospholipid/cholesterol/gamma-HCH transport system ATP-binding protein